MHNSNTKRVTMSRKQAAKVLNCEVSPFGDLCAIVNGIFVNGWTSGKRRRVDRITVNGVSGRTNAVESFRLAKRLHAATGLTTHFHFGMLNRVFVA